MKDFLDKVKSGTVTQDDLNSIQAELKQDQQSGPDDAIKNSPPPIDRNDNKESSSADIIKSFLDKVKSGTVTQDDLQNMETQLKQQEQS